MGSGRGQMRRTQVSIATAHGQKAFIEASRRRWAEFVLASGLSEVKLHQYYLGRGFVASADPRKIVEDALKLVAELFADMVAVGVVSLPSSQEVDDFQLMVYQGLTYMFHKDKPNVKAVLLNPSQSEEH